MPLRITFSFFNVQRYPPSLDFLLVTLGPAMIVLALFDPSKETCGRLRSGLRRVLVTFGRVPLFYDLLHLPSAEPGGGFGLPVSCSHLGIFRRGTPGCVWGRETIVFEDGR